MRLSAYGVGGILSRDFKSGDTSALAYGSLHWWAQNDVSPVKVGAFVLPTLGYTRYNDTNAFTYGGTGILAASSDLVKDRLSLEHPACA